MFLFSFKSEAKRNLKTGWANVNLLTFSHGTKVLITSHLLIRGRSGAAEIHWEPAVDGNSQLHNTWPSNHTRSSVDGKHLKLFSVLNGTEPGECQRMTIICLLAVLLVKRPTQSNVATLPCCFQWFPRLDTPSCLAVTLWCVIHRWP